MAELVLINDARLNAITEILGNMLEEQIINEFIIMQTLFTLKWAGNQGVRVDFVSSNQRTP